MKQFLSSSRNKWRLGLSLVVVVTLLAGIAFTIAQATASHAADLPMASSLKGHKWGIVSSPSPGKGAILSDVSAAAKNDMWSVGVSLNVKTGGENTLIEHWNGSAWSVVTSPNVGTIGSNLRGVVALTKNDAWAVGSYFDATAVAAHTLIEHWNGKKWSVVTSPNVGTSTNGLSKIAAVSANDIWAIGVYRDGTTIRPLTLHWDGKAWSVVANASVANTTFTSLTAITVVAANDVWAVGNATTTAKNTVTLIEHWDGKAWSVVASPNLDTNSSLTGVAAVSATDVWAVGISSGSAHGFQSVTMHWDGKAWSVVASIASGYTGVYTLTNVTAISKTDVWAVGAAVDSTGLHPFSIHWDGKAWTAIATAPTPQKQLCILGGLTKTQTGPVSVGLCLVPSKTSVTIRTLTEMYK